MSSSPYCAFWDVVSGSVPTWSTEGVVTDASMMNDSGTVVCFSRHLTNFAVIAVSISTAFITSGQCEIIFVNLLNWHCTSRQHCRMRGNAQR